MEISAYTFGPFRLEPAKRLLLRDGVPVPLTPRAFDLLVAVVERRERVVDKEEALRLLWPDTVVEEANLTQNVFLLRKALGDNQDDARFIATVPRRGYRFVAEVREIAAPPGERPPAPAEPASPPPAAPRRRRALGAGLALVALALASAAGFWAGRRSAEPPEPPRFQRLTFRRGEIQTARFAPDGRSVIYSASWDDEPPRVFVARPENPESQPLDLPPAQVMAVSRRGDLALLLRPPRLQGGIASLGTLARVPLGGGTPRELLENVAWADWGPDGESLAVVRIVGGATRRLEYPVGRVLAETLPAACMGPIRVSPQGSHVAFLSCDPGEKLSIVIVDAQGRRVAQTRAPGYTSLLAWSPDGAEVWYSAANGPREFYPEMRGLSRSGRDRLVERLPGAVLDLAPGGRALVALGQFRAGIVARGPDASEEREVSWLEGSLGQDLSADGRLLLFGERFEGGGPRGRIYLRATDGLSPAVYLGEGEPGGLSPDGRWMVAAIQGRRGLTLAPTGPGEPRDLDAGGLHVYAARFFRDGRRLLLGAEQPGRPGRLWLMGLDGGAPQPLTPELTGMGVPSPDGRLVAGIGHEGTWLYPVDGGERRPAAGVQADEWPVAWADDGWLYVARQDELPLNVYRVEPLSGRRELWRSLKPADPAGVRRLTALVSADGRAYAYSYMRSLSDLYLVEGLR